MPKGCYDARRHFLVAPSITIVIPAHNAAATLADTLDSVRRQTRTDWIAHIVDDASTDDTAAIGAAYCERDARFRLFHVAAGGVCGASNHGAAQATTPWLAFLHSDDLYREDFVAEMLAAASRASTASRTIVYAQCQHMAGDGRLGRIERPPRDDHQRYLCTACIFYTCAVVLARDLFVAIGGYDEGLRTAEDWDLYVRLFAAGAQPIGVERPLAIYRLRPGSLARTYDRMFHDARTVIDRAYRAISREPVPEDVDRSAFLVGLWHAGVSIGAGRADCGFLRDLPVPERVRAFDAAEHLVLGIAAGACGLPEDWPRLWARFREPIVDNLDVLGPQRDTVMAELESRATALAG
jgi:glycosyltransferase involved in cell wall biosynthesis